MKKKRLVSSVLLAASLFVAALPVQASSWQGFDLYPTITEKASRWHVGQQVQITVHHNQGNLGDTYWELRDGYGTLIDSGTVYYQGDGFSSEVYDIEPTFNPNHQQAQLTLYCQYYDLCNTYGTIETW
ncbi:hypothetical protein WBG83_16975 [Paenibacillus sp. y28]